MSIGRPPMYSVKQFRFLLMPLVAFNWLVGVTGSGKSHIQAQRAYEELLRLGPKQRALFAGNTTETLYKNLISEILKCDMGANKISYAQNRSPAIKTANGAEGYCFGANNSTAEDRNQAMIANTIAKMQKEGQNLAALVTGGYHTKGLTDILRQKETSYLFKLC